MTDDRPIQQFPDTYSIKAMGRDESEFADHVASIIREVVGAASAIDTRTRASSKGGYVSVTASFNAVSQEQLDEVFRLVSADARVVWVL